MDAKLVNPFVDAFTAVMPQIGFQDIKRNKISVCEHAVTSKGVTVLVGFTKEIKGNVAYNMTENTARLIASTMMMGMPVDQFDDMAQSAISELSNMLTANAATNLSSLGYNVDISTPSLSVGVAFKVKVSSEAYLSVEMDVGGGHMVEIDIAVQ